MVEEFDGGGEELAEVPYHDIMELFETLTFKEKWARIREGLKQPPESGAYKWAKLEMTRLWSPVSAVIVPIIALLLMAMLAALTPKRQQNVEIKIAEVEVPDELEEPEDIPEPEIEPPDPEKIIEPTENFIPSTSDNDAPDTDFSPQPAQFDSVAIVKSPVTMKGIFGSRSPGARGSALGRYGGGGHTEGAVLRALRWLKKNQEDDGSWSGTSGGGAGRANVQSAMTGMGLLTFLAHGETPASPEFGQTVKKAIEYLVGKNNSFPRPYQFPIATYALCEAFSMTKVPSIKAAAAQGIGVIISGQNPTGGFDYELTPCARDDTSIMGWCAQALKAGKMAGIQNPGLDDAIEKAIKGFQKNYAGDSQMGGFGYIRPKASELTGVGVLCMQLLGAQNEKECRGGLNRLIEKDTFAWPAHWKKVYYWYYNTQARFHEGGECWRAWNKQFSVPLVKGQTIIANGIQDMNGKMVDIGYWETNNDRGGRVMDTALCALMLQVYYRYLPTFQKPEDIAQDGGGGEAKEEAGVVAAKDLDIDVQL